jgi:hypothetical protein
VQILLRHMTYSEARKMPIQEFHLDAVLKDLELSMDEVRYKSRIGPFLSHTSLLCRFSMCR